MCSTKALTWIMIPLIVGFFTSSIMLRVQQDVPDVVVMMNGDGVTASVLVIYHPGLSSFQHDVMESYASGLAEADWSITMTTASPSAPENLGAFDLLVLGSPTYAWKPASSVTRYVQRLGALRGIPTVLVLTGGGSTAGAASRFSEMATAAGADVIDVLEIWQGAPNAERHGISNAMEIARRAGAALGSL